MNQLIGTIFTGLITDENDVAYFIQKEGVTFKLDKEEGEHKLGEAVEGFGYVNQEQQNRFTTSIPQVHKGNFAFGEAVASRKDLGVFVNIGLKDKEIVISLDDLPVMRQLWPKAGDQVMVSLDVDERGRMWAILADEKIFHAMSRPAKEEEMKNKNVSGIAYRLKVIGTFVLTDDFHIGFIHPSERYIEPRLGEKVTGRVIGVRPDGILNISLKPRAHEVISDDAAMILTFLEKSADGKIPFTDKSTPEEITRTFAISKAQFKRAIGSLLKKRLIKQEDGFTILLNPESEIESN